MEARQFPCSTTTSSVRMRSLLLSQNHDVGVKKASRRIQQLVLKNSIIVPSQGKSGGLWLIWDDDYDVSQILKNSNLIAAKVKGKGPQSDWIIVSVYGDPARASNPYICEQIDGIIEEENLPVLVIGDFNSIASMDEKWGGSQVFKSGNMAFRNWVNESGLIDLGHRGPAYTWSNKKQGNSNISQRLDRALGNLNWTMQYPNSAVYHLPRLNSDYLPILLRPPPPPKKTPKHHFVARTGGALNQTLNQFVRRQYTNRALHRRLCNLVSDLSYRPG